MNGKCKQCGCNELTTGDIDGICTACKNENAQNKSNLPEIFYTRGWICPVCGAGLNPAIAQCPCIYSVGTITIGGNKIDSLTITGQSEGISIQ
jgi:hypothetical protein